MLDGGQVNFKDATGEYSFALFVDHYYDDRQDLQRKQYTDRKSRAAPNYWAVYATLHRRKGIEPARAQA